MPKTETLDELLQRLTGDLRILNKALAIVEDEPDSAQYGDDYYEALQVQRLRGSLHAV